MTLYDPALRAALLHEVESQRASPPVWVPRLRGALGRGALHQSTRLGDALGVELESDYVVDTLRVVHGPLVRPAHPSLFGRDYEPTFAMRVAINLRSADEPEQIRDLREELPLGPGLWLEWVYVRPWFLDEKSDPQLPALRVLDEDFASLDSSLQDLFARVLQQRVYDRGARVREAR